MPVKIKITRIMYLKYPRNKSFTAGSVTVSLHLLDEVPEFFTGVPKLKYVYGN